MLLPTIGLLTLLIFVAFNLQKVLGKSSTEDTISDCKLEKLRLLSCFAGFVVQMLETSVFVLTVSRGFGTDLLS